MTVKEGQVWMKDPAKWMTGEGNLLWFSGSEYRVPINMLTIDIQVTLYMVMRNGRWITSYLE